MTLRRPENNVASAWNRRLRAAAHRCHFDSSALEIDGNARRVAVQRFCFAGPNDPLHHSDFFVSEFLLVDDWRRRQNNRE